MWFQGLGPFPVPVRLTRTVAEPPQCPLRCRRSATNHRQEVGNGFRQGEAGAVRPDEVASLCSASR